ncbi:MAG: ribosome recycling factor [Gammaproteobacteria bacterium]|nr:ribosome recycling factor [Gammaproteobacteria bacterium]MBT6073317.1 ribosome recycling factor [Gammaproteobacteria bacterium]MBT7753065.1 ribosome recycling factor [Gammaproteobacteria bacterium]MDG2435003.1 ribosome recycling factor [Gammaproteobacteria bacterium]
MLEEVNQEANERMEKSINAFKANLTKVRTGRASPDILDSIHLDYYGNETPLKQLSNISVEDSQTLTISPWEEKFIPEIEQAIMKANIGLNPVTTGNIIRIPLPALTEERRVELTKQVKSEGEQAKISIRNIRRDSIQDLKDFLNEKMISEDDYHKGQTVIQNITDNMIENIDSLSENKQKELMTI